MFKIIPISHTVMELFEKVFCRQTVIDIQHITHTHTPVCLCLSFGKKPYVALET